MLAPTSSGNSVELCLNSRVSYHDGYKGQASEKWLSNVIWAAGQAPITGDHRDIYITTPYGKYLYEPDTHALSNRTSGRSGDSAFILDYDRELDFDAGVSSMFALLESVSLWDGTGSQLASCPKQESLYFGIRDVEALTEEVVVTSSDGSLPDPETNGDDSLEDVIANLKYTDNFTGEDISLEDLSQLLWAGYGGTPHTTYNGRGGLTVPSWCAEYFLTENIYVVKQDGVFRYHNRNPGSDLTTRDHMLELIKEGDVREELRSAIRELPDAPCYVVLCLDAEDRSKWYAHLETGFVGGNMLLQGSAMGVGSWFTTELSEDAQLGIQEVVEVKVDDVPAVVMSVGYV
ncbi:MAG: nitroreductase family protein [ANME-2 cluster archaeon]|nr:nitroreductase family protein [ANME-2 cluster archaeon]